MNRAGHEKTKYFIGPEVEHTPAYSKKTLFVVGYQSPQEVEKYARQYKVQHVFLGANHSFDVEANSDVENKNWNDLATHLLDRGFWVTIDYQAHQHKDVLNIFSAGVWQSRLFVPLLSVRIPKIEMSSPNLTVKIDDIDFKATNPGVWCRHFTELTDSNRFTDWQDYVTDEDVTGQVNISASPSHDVLPTPMPPYVVRKEPEREITYIDPSDLIAKQVKAVEKAETPVQNDASLGLDPTSPSQLKAEADEEVKSEVVLSQGSSTKQEVADLYAHADGTTETQESGAKKAASKKK